MDQEGLWECWIYKTGQYGQYGECLLLISSSFPWYQLWRRLGANIFIYKLLTWTFYYNALIKAEKVGQLYEYILNWSAYRNLKTLKWFVTLVHHMALGTLQHHQCMVYCTLHHHLKLCDPKCTTRLKTCIFSPWDSGLPDKIGQNCDEVLVEFCLSLSKDNYVLQIWSTNFMRPSSTSYAGM